MNCEISSTWTFIAGGITGGVIVILSVLLGLWMENRR